MKVIALITIILSLNARAEFFIINGKEGNKADATRALLLDSKAKVVKCEEQEITNKATLRKK